MADYIVKRWLPEAVRQACAILNLGYETFSDEWIIRISSPRAQHWIFGYGFDLNSYPAAQNANDKVACYQILQKAGIPVLPHYLIRPEILSPTYLHKLKDKLRGDIILKPLSGTSGRDITMHSSLDDVLEYVKERERPDWCVAPFINIAYERRIILFDNELLLAYEKIPAPTNDPLIFYNLGKGATARVVVPSSQEIEIAQKALRALCLRIGAIDIVIQHDGTQQIIEVNSGLMMEYFMRQSEEYKRIGYDIYQKLITAMMQES